MAVDLLIDVLNGLSRGSLAFLIAAGLTLALGVMGTLNLAHGAKFMLGAYLAWYIATRTGDIVGSFWIAAILAAATVGVVGFLIEFLLLRRTYHAPHVLQILLTVGVLLLIEGAIIAVWGPAARTVSLPSTIRGSTMILGQRFPTYLLFVLVASLAFAVALWAFVYKTRIGMQARAAAMDPEMSGALGINVPMVYTVLFVVGAVLAGGAGAVGVGLQAVNLALGIDALLVSFVIIVVGGLGSLKGAFVAALLLGLIESLGGRWIPDLAIVFPFLLMAVVLTLRPQGLFGQE